MSQYLPTGNFKWMTDKEISKTNLGKYKADSNEGMILEVDLEYPKELHDLHNDYPIAPEKVKVSNDMLSAYCKKIAKKVQHINRTGKETHSNIEGQKRIRVALS